MLALAPARLFHSLGLALASWSGSVDSLLASAAEDLVVALSATFHFRASAAVVSFVPGHS